LKLCQLLFDVGAVAASEILLRRNLDCYDGEALYTKLFGTKKQDEYDAAIEAFKTQFDLSLVFVERHSFLDSTFLTTGGLSCSGAFALLAKPCEIRFGYNEPERIEAEIALAYPERAEPDWVDEADCLSMFLVNGVWKIAAE